MQYALAGLTTLLFAVSLIHPRFPQEQLLQHTPTVLVLPALFLAARKRWLTTGSLACIAAFWCLHIVGARYIYSYVPYDDWARQAFGSSPAEWFGWRRNHYDRFVHLAFGVLWMPPAFEVARRYGRLPRFWAIGFALGGAAALSASYEIFEWLLTVFVAPDQADAYNGQQGDMWDAQKDMACALAGSLAALPVVLAGRKAPPTA